MFFEISVIESLRTGTSNTGRLRRHLRTSPMNSTIPTPKDLSFQHTHMLCDVIESIFERHGIASSLAHLYAVVFSSAEQPVRLTDAAEVAGVAKSTASVGLRKLEACGLVSKHTLHTERQDAYSPNPAAVRMLMTHVEQTLMPTFVQLHQLHHILGAMLADPGANAEGRDNISARLHETRCATRQLGRVLEALRSLPASEPQRTPYGVPAAKSDQDGLPPALSLQ